MSSTREEGTRRKVDMETRETVATVQAKRGEGWHKRHGGAESPLSGKKPPSNRHPTWLPPS